MNLIELLNANGGSPQTRQQDRIYGVVTGLVHDIKDPKHQGRVKVDFPWLAPTKDEVADSGEDKAHSYWARIAMLMAGKNRGSWFIPDVGDEVLVAFEHGHINRPIIIGGLWNVEDTPPERMDGEGKNDIRSIHSRSGHKIVLNDSDDEPSILIVDKTGDNSIYIDSANNAMEIKVKGDLTIEVGGNISITAKGKIEVDATRDITAQTKANLKLKATVDGTGQAEVKAAAVSVNGTGMTEIKGGLNQIP